MKRKTELDPIEVLRAFVDKHGTQVAAARALGVSKPHITDLLYGRRGFSPAMLDKLGLQRIVIQRKAS